jgi:hypothetical protein
MFKILSFKGRSSKRITRRSKVAPAQAPGGTVFHHGTMTTKDIVHAAIAAIGHHSWRAIRPTPAPTHPTVVASHKRPNARPIGLCKVTSDESSDGCFENPEREELHDAKNPLR